MDIRKLQKIAVAALEDIKGEDIEVIDTKKLTALFDRIIVVTGNSNRQTRSLARNLQDRVREAGGTIYGVEGEDSGEWVLVDLGDMVVHIMLASVRAYYNLEELWLAGRKRAARGGEAEAGATVSPAPKKRRAPAAATAKPEAAEAGGGTSAARRPAAVRRAVAPKAAADAAPAPRRRRTPGKTA